MFAENSRSNSNNWLLVKAVLILLLESSNVLLSSFGVGDGVADLRFVLCNSNDLFECNCSEFDFGDTVRMAYGEKRSTDDGNSL